MSQLRSRNASGLRGFAGSSLRDFGPGFKTHEVSIHEDLAVEWDVDIYEHNVNQNTVAHKGKAGVIIGPYFLNMWSAGIEDRGKNEWGAALTKPYTGTPAPLTDTISSNSLDLSPGGLGGSSFFWNAWPATSQGGLPEEPFWEDTGSSVIIRGFTQIFPNTDFSGSIDGILVYGHFMFLQFNGFSWQRDVNRTLEWITLYFTGLNGVSMANPSGPGDTVRLLLRYKVTVSV